MNVVTVSVGSTRIVEDLPTTLPRTDILNADTIKDIASSVGVESLPFNITKSLTTHLEHHLHSIVDEASKFTRHSRRCTLSTTDIDQAFNVLNIEPIYGIRPTVWKEVVPEIGESIYYAQDEIIDFEMGVKMEEVQVARKVAYTAHWLAIQGVQPAIPQNPVKVRAIVKAPDIKTELSNVQEKLIDYQPELLLPKELRLYYDRLVDILLPSNSTKAKEEERRFAALAILRRDAVQPLIPSLIRWIGEKAKTILLQEDRKNHAFIGWPWSLDGENALGLVEREKLDVLLRAIGALVSNRELFIGNFLPPILSILHSILLYDTPPTLPSTYISIMAPSPTFAHLRLHSSQIIDMIVRLHSHTHPSLTKYITKTLLAVLDDPGKLLGAKEGALRGLCAVSKEAVRRAVVEEHALRMVGEDVRCAKELEIDTEEIEAAAMDVLAFLHPPSCQTPQTLVDSFEPHYKDLHTPSDIQSPLPQNTQTFSNLKDILGEFFAMKVAQDDEWAKSLSEELSVLNFQSKSSN